MRRARRKPRFILKKWLSNMEVRRTGSSLPGTCRRRCRRPAHPLPLRMLWAASSYSRVGILPTRSTVPERARILSAGWAIQHGPKHILCSGPCSSGPCSRHCPRQRPAWLLGAALRSRETNGYLPCFTHPGVVQSVHKNSFYCEFLDAFEDLSLRVLNTCHMLS